MTDSALRALMAIDEIARDPADWRRSRNGPYRYEARTSIRPQRGALSSSAL